MAGRIGRPIFRRSDVQVAVRPIRLSRVETVEPGTVMNDLVRPHHLRGLYQRRRIGPQGHPWTIAMLEHDGFYKPEAHRNKPALEPQEPNPEHEAQIEAAKEALQKWVEMEPTETDEGWTVEGADEPFESEEDAQAFIAQQHAAVESLLLAAGVEPTEDEEPKVEEVPETQPVTPESEEQKTGLMGRLMGKGKNKAKPAEEATDNDGDDWLDGENGA